MTARCKELHKQGAKAEKAFLSNLANMQNMKKGLSCRTEHEKGGVGDVPSDILIQRTLGLDRSEPAHWIGHGRLQGAGATSAEGGSHVDIC